MTKRFISGTAVALMAAAALVSGCGGGGSSTTETAKESSPQAKTQVRKIVLKPQAPLTKVQFIQRADLGCARSYEERGNILIKYANRAVPPSKSKQEQLLFEAIFPNFRHDLESLEALAKRSAPKGDEATLAKMLEDYASSLAEAEENPELVLTDAPKQFAETTRLARGYGFQACGSF